MSEKLKFYLDENIDVAIAKELLRRGIDVVTPHEIGMRTKSDPEHLDRATAEGRVLVTKDKDFLRLNASGQAHSGIAFCQGIAGVGELVDGPTLLFEVYEQVDMESRIEYL